MCRYAFHAYKDTYACFSCRKGFKRVREEDLLPKSIHPDRKAKCPDCGLAAANLGKDLKLPRKFQTEQWAAIEYLFNNQFNFFTCGCEGLGVIPQSLAEAYELVEKRARKSAGEVLLRKITS
jgi:DNA-directed RNA polymerase subunit RPC12/RpoP